MDVTKQQSKPNQQQQQESGKKTRLIIVYVSIVVMLISAVVALIRAHYNKHYHCTVSIYLLFSLYLALFLFFLCWGALDRPSAPWYIEDSRKKECFFYSLWLICTFLNLSMALEITRAFGRFFPWILYGFTIVTLVLGYYVIFVLDKKLVQRQMMQQQQQQQQTDPCLKLSTKDAIKIGDQVNPPSIADKRDVA